MILVSVMSKVYKEQEIITNAVIPEDLLSLLRPTVQVPPPPRFRLYIQHFAIDLYHSLNISTAHVG